MEYVHRQNNSQDPVDIKKKKKMTLQIYNRTTEYDHIYIK